jgi:hypothetical protein
VRHFKCGAPLCPPFSFSPSCHLNQHNRNYDQLAAKCLINGNRKSGFRPQKRVRLRDNVPVLLLVLWKILMPLASWLSRAYVSMWFRSRLTGIARVRSTRLIGLARLASVGAFRIASLRPNGHREILQFFPNQTQFVDDLFSYLVFHIEPLQDDPSAKVPEGIPPGVSDPRSRSSSPRKPILTFGCASEKIKLPPVLASQTWTVRF